MIDTHAHLDFANFDTDRGQVIETCRNNGVKAIVNIGIDMQTSRDSVKLAEQYEFIYATVGFHPHDAKDMGDCEFEELKQLAKHPKVVAIGEIGLDYYRDLSPRHIQKDVFIKQLKLAAEINLPVVLHIRQALDDAYDILEKHPENRGILHAFPGDESYAARGIEMGYSIAFGGPITYPKSKGARVAGSIPLSKIVTETDCPFLPPQTFRGLRNQPDYIRYVIEKLSEIFPKYNYEDIERITEKNAVDVFNIAPVNNPEMVYRIGDSLYINLTMRCTNNCYFCPKNKNHTVAGHNLLLSRDPSESDILSAVEDHSGYNEIVFCGLGEPTLRADLLFTTAGKLKSKNVPIRLNTNGQGNAINKKDLTRRMAGLIDIVNVSLNAENAEIYKKICRPQFGERIFDEVIKFARGCKAAGIKTVFSVVDLPEIDIDQCRRLAVSEQIELRIRSYVPD